MANLQFDASQVAPDTGYDVVPAGWYEAMIDDSEIKPTKGGDGAYLNLRFSLLTPHVANRKVFHRLNIRNANATAQEIAYKQLSAIAHAVGVLQVQDSAQLHNIPIKIRVKVRKGDDNYDDSNEITAFRHHSEQVEIAQPRAAGAAPGMPPAAPQYAPPAPPPAGLPFPPAQAPQYPPQGQAPQAPQQPAYAPPPAPQPAQAPQQPAQAPQAPQAPAPQPDPAQQPWTQAPQQPWTQPPAAAAQGQAPQAPQPPAAPAPQGQAPLPPWMQHQQQQQQQ